MNEQDVRTFLDDLAHTPAPPPTVDVEQAMTTVRRRTRVRALTSVSAAVLVVGVAAGVTYAVVDRSPSSTGAAATPTVAAPVAPRQFDPLIRYASFGWLPEQSRLTWQSTSISAEQFALNAGEYVPDSANGPGVAMAAAYVNLRLYSAGTVPLTEKPLEVGFGDDTKTLEYGPVTEAPAVDGAPASWVGVPNDTETVVLKWRYAPDAWAELYAAKLPGDLRETAHRIASELSVGGTERLRFPFQLTGLSPELKPVASQYTEGGPDRAWEASLDLNTEPDGQGSNLGVLVHPTNASETKEPNIEIDGRPARRDTVGGDHLGVPQYSDRLSVADLEGLQANIIIAATDPAAAAPMGPDGVLSVFRALTVLPDRADWTDQPQR